MSIHQGRELNKKKKKSKIPTHDKLLVQME